VINKAIKAQTLDDIQVRPEHIISILTDEENECVKIFKRIKRRYYYITR
jgi:hypothetical protein